MPDWHAVVDASPVAAFVLRNEDLAAGEVVHRNHAAKRLFARHEASTLFEVIDPTSHRELSELLGSIAAG